MRGACGRKRGQLASAPSGRGRAPSTTAARSTLPPTLVLVSDDAELRAIMERTICRSRMAILRTMTVAQASRTVTWVVSRPPEVLVVDAQDLGMAARNGLQRAVRAALGARCRVIIATAVAGSQGDAWRGCAEDAPVVVRDDEAVFSAAMARAVADALRAQAARAAT